MKRNLDEYTPELLGKDFVNVIVVSSSPSYFEKYRQDVELNSQAILECFKKNGNLFGLEFVGISKDSKVWYFLTLLLNHGVEESKKILKKKEIPEEQKSVVQHKIKFKPNDGLSGSWENGMKILEGD